MVATDPLIYLASKTNKKKKKSKYFSFPKKEKEKSQISMGSYGLKTVQEDFTN